MEIVVINSEKQYSSSAITVVRRYEYSLANIAIYDLNEEEVTT